MCRAEVAALLEVTVATPNTVCNTHVGTNYGGGYGLRVGRAKGHFTLLKLGSLLNPSKRDFL